MAKLKKAVLLNDTGEEIRDALLGLRARNDYVNDVQTTDALGNHTSIVDKDPAGDNVAIIPFIPENVTDLADGYNYIKRIYTDEGIYINEVAETGSYNSLTSGLPYFSTDKIDPSTGTKSIPVKDNISVRRLLEDTDLESLMKDVDLKDNGTIIEMKGDIGTLETDVGKLQSEVEGDLFTTGLLDRTTSLEGRVDGHDADIRVLKNRATALEEFDKYKVGDINDLPQSDKTITKNINILSDEKQDNLVINGVDSGLAFNHGGASGDTLTMNTWDNTGMPADKLTALKMVNNTIALNYVKDVGLDVTTENKLTTVAADKDTKGVVKVDENTIIINNKGQLEVKNEIPDPDPITGSIGQAPVYDYDGKLHLTDIATQLELDTLREEITSGTVIIEKAKRDQNGDIIDQTYIKGAKHSPDLGSDFAVDPGDMKIIIPNAGNMDTATGAPGTLGVVYADATTVKVHELDGKLSVVRPVPAWTAGDNGKALTVNAAGTGLEWKVGGLIDDVKTYYNDSEGHRQSMSLVDGATKVAALNLGFGLLFDPVAKEFSIDYNGLATQAELADLEARIVEKAKDRGIVAGKAYGDENGDRISTTYLKRVKLGDYPDYLVPTSPDQQITIPLAGDVIPGVIYAMHGYKGIEVVNDVNGHATMIQHTNNIAAETTGLGSVATNNVTKILTGIKYDAQGHFTASGETQIPVMQGCSATAAGYQGYVPDTAAGDQFKYLGGNAKWHKLTSIDGITCTQTDTETNFKHTNAIVAGQQGQAMDVDFSDDLVTFLTVPFVKYDAQGHFITDTNQHEVTIPVFTGATAAAAGKKGLVPKPAAGDTYNYLTGGCTYRGKFDGCTATTNGLQGLVTTPTAGKQHYYLAGDSTWRANFKGCTATAAGELGLVPIPAAGQQHYYPSGAGTWRGAFKGCTATAAGEMGLVPIPKAGENANYYLKGDGTWSKLTPVTQAQYQADTTYSNPNIADETNFPSAKAAFPAVSYYEVDIPINTPAGTLDVTVPGCTAKSHPIIDVVCTNDTTYADELEAFGMIYKAVSYAGYIKIYFSDTTPAAMKLAIRAF